MTQSMIILTILIIVSIAIGFLVRWYLSVRSLKEDAEAEYTLRTMDKPASINNVDQSQFVDIYVSSHQPRWALYAAAGLLAALITSPIAMMLVAWIYNVIWQMNGAPEWGGREGYVFMFSLFFGIVFCWAMVAGVFARLFHQRIPEPFVHQLARARGEPIPEETSWRRRPKWARMARPVADTNDSDPDPNHDEGETA